MPAPFLQFQVARFEKYTLTSLVRNLCLIFEYCGRHGYSEIVFRAGKAVIGMIHVPALPGAPRCSMNFEEIRQFVLTDSAALAEGGVDGLMIENFGDVPFYATRVPAHTVAFLSTRSLSKSKRDSRFRLESMFSGTTEWRRLPSRRP
jgi:hypothetical protein